MNLTKIKIQIVFWPYNLKGCAAFFIDKGKFMDIYVYSDESGVFDVTHNKFYIFGGILFLSKTEKDNQIRKYLAAECNIRKSEKVNIYQELKASFVSNKSKSKL